MCYYPGGKKKYGKAISNKINEHAIRWNEFFPDVTLKGYCEPFCGMCGVYQYIPSLLGDSLCYLAGDLDPSIIKMWNASTKEGWIAPTCCSRELFYDLKKSTVITPDKAFLGRAMAFKSTYFTTYCEHNNIKNQARSVDQIGKSLKDVTFKVGDYTQFSNLEGYILYLDPPYRNTTCKYYGSNGKLFSKFDSDAFDDWISLISKRNLVFSTEYSDLPYTKIWSKDREILYLINV